MRSVKYILPEIQAKNADFKGYESHHGRRSDNVFRVRLTFILLKDPRIQSDLNTKDANIENPILDVMTVV